MSVGIQPAGGTAHPRSYAHLARIETRKLGWSRYIQYSANAPWRAPCPRLSRLTSFAISLPVGNWIVFYSFVIDTRSRLRINGRFAPQAVDHEFCLGEIQTARSLHRPSRRTRGSWASDGAVALQLLPKREVTEFALCDLRSRENLRVSEHRPLMEPEPMNPLSFGFQDPYAPPALRRVDIKLGALPR